MPLDNHCEVVSLPGLFPQILSERPGLIYLGDINQLLEVELSLWSYKAVESDGGQVAHCHLLGGRDRHGTMMWVTREGYYSSPALTHLIRAAVLDDLCAEVATSDRSQILHEGATTARHVNTLFVL